MHLVGRMLELVMSQHPQMGSFDLRLAGIVTVRKGLAVALIVLSDQMESAVSLVQPVDRMVNCLTVAAGQKAKCLHQPVQPVQMGFVQMQVCQKHSLVVPAPMCSPGQKLILALV